MSERKALTIQGILVIVVGVILLVSGGVGSLRTLMRPVAPRVPVVGSINPANPLAAIHKSRALLRQVQRYASMGWMALLGGAMIAAGGFILKGKDKARYVGFGGVAFAILYFAGQQGTVAASSGLLLPAILTTLVAGLSSVLLWDLMQAKLEG